MIVGSCYRDSRGNNFIVENTFETGEGKWVRYYNKETKQAYECLQGAFLERFTLFNNYRYY